MAIDFETVVAAVTRDDRHLSAYSLNYGEQATCDLDNPGRTRRGIWLDYVEGVAQALEKRGVRLRGADMMILSDVPAGAGLSSSAALEVSVGFALTSLAGAEVDRVALALACQEAEHVYVGAQVGIMDQLIAVLGRRGHALLIDCRTLEAAPVPLDSSEAAVVVCDTHVKHRLASSEYNRRRAECEQGLGVLQRALPEITALRDVTAVEFEQYGERLPETIRRRCRHVITENERTLRAAEALRRGGLEEVGRLMYLSHHSLRDDYEVSIPELNVLVGIAEDCPGVLGARMTGGGFGGCTVNLVRREAVEVFIDRVSRGYYAATKITPSVYFTEASEGAREIT
jgi:galactokinase